MDIGLDMFSFSRLMNEQTFLHSGQDKIATILLTTHTVCFSLYASCISESSDYFVLFQINQDFVPEGFLGSDVWVGDARHILFASDDMLMLLANARTW